jgi:DNA-binding CsgD family transcriptional regulator
LSDDAITEPIRFALKIADAALADRLAALLASVPGLQLVATTESAEVVIVLPESSSQADGDLKLTPRELEVLALLAEGASNKTIAQRLGISVHTAKFHVGAVIDKLDAIGRTDAVAQAARLHIINL